MKKHVLFLLSLAAFAVTACSDDEDGAIEPSVSLSDIRVEANAVTFTVNPDRAVACAYICHKAEEQTPGAEQILSAGTAVSPSAATTVTLEELDWNADYTIAVAVRSEDGLFATDTSGFSVREGIEPSVSLSDIQVEANTVTFTVNPDRAAVCAYICHEAGEQTPDAEQILSEGTTVSSSAATTVTLDGLNWEADYTIAVAVRSEDGLFATNTSGFSVGKDPATDLGDPANCYIVSEEGLYSFAAKKVSGAEIADIATVDWIWSTRSEGSDQQQLVSDIVYSGGRIRFNATGNRGNIVLAAFDANGKIVWSWHIWCTEQPETMTYENGKTFQDRNIGATAAVIGSTDSYGLYYQWGRKDPFYGGIEAEESGAPFTQAVAATIVNPAYGLAWKYIGEGADLMRSVAEPMSFFHLEGSKSNDWISQTDNSLWGMDKTDYDPCPAGYRVPSSDEVVNLGKLNEDAYDWDNYGGIYTYNGQTAWYPAQGNRDIQGTLEIFPEGSSMTWLNDWQTAGSSDFGKRLIINDWGGMIAPGARSFGQAVRCVAE